jgi:hypothetical protein
MSGEVKIENGQLVLSGIAYRNLSDYKAQNQPSQNITNRESIGEFRMEPGRTLFVNMRICNEAMRCTSKALGSVVITGHNSQMTTSTAGEAIEMEISTSGSRGRDKRAAQRLHIRTPNG